MIVVYPRDKWPVNFIATKVPKQNHPEVPAKQVSFWTPTTRTSSSDDHQKFYLHEAYDTDMMSSGNQDRPNRMTTNTDSCSLRFHSSVSLNAQIRNRLLHSVWVDRATCGSPEAHGPPRICQYLSATPVSISC